MLYFDLDIDMVQILIDVNVYFVLVQSKWFFVGFIVMMVIMVGVVSWFNDVSWGCWMFYIGIVMLVLILFWWFSDVVCELQVGNYNYQVDGLFWMGMIWFIFFEVMFFGVFFGVLFYICNLGLLWLSGEGRGVMINELFWQGYFVGWLINGLVVIGGVFQMILVWGLLLINMLILFIFGVILIIVYYVLKVGNCCQLLIWLGLIVVFGFGFLILQVEEYIYVYKELNLMLGLGIYGLMFFMLIGFYGVYVLLGMIMLIVMWLCLVKGYFICDNYFGFEVVVWYWYFVDVVWLMLFLFVYVF